MEQKYFDSYIHRGDIETRYEVFINRVHESFLTPPHTHDFIEINYVAEGRGYHYINGSDPLAVRRGDIFILPVGTSHMYRPYSANHQEPLIVYNAVFPFELVPMWSRSMPVPPQLEAFLMSGKQHYRQYADPDGSIGQLFDQMYQEFVQKPLGYTSLLMSSAIAILIRLLRLEMKIELEQLRTASKLDDVFQYIQRHYCETIPLKKAADLACLSPGHFSQIFRAATGRTLVEYIQNMRIDKSCSLLCTTTMKIAQIAEMVGYQDLRFFQNIFKRKTGTTPSEFRKRFSAGSYAGSIDRHDGSSTVIRISSS
ncbi:helix-turn-helix domain-containing protein [Paenibacillus sp. GCM10027626]|uniref:AraC family transcriptional regulator n=1 Tax=Paenibacillus sp. GCM10027626 TaxID=3273411 RepID=UPI0036357315